jgi:hypothetical protein
MLAGPQVLCSSIFSKPHAMQCIVHLARQRTHPTLYLSMHAGAPVLCSSIFSKPSALRQVSTALLRTFELDPSSAALLLRAQAGFAGGEVTAAAAASGDAHVASGKLPADGSSSLSVPAAAGAGVAKLRAAAGHPLLPRMPLSLQYLTSMESYKAAAGLARALGRAARVADNQQQQVVTLAGEDFVDIGGSESGVKAVGLRRLLAWQEHSGGLHVWPTTSSRLWH